MRGTEISSRVQLDLNIAEFQENLFGLEKADRHSAIQTLRKLLRMTWEQVYSDKRLKWEKIAGKDTKWEFSDLFFADFQSLAEHLPTETVM